MRLFYAGIIPLLFMQEAYAAEQKAMSTPPVMIGQVLLGLTLVVGLILLMAWVLKKLGHGGVGYSKAMRVVATLPLSTREKATLVQVGDKQILLGVAPGRVNCLHVFDEPAIKLDDSTSGSGPHSDFSGRFKEILSQRMGR